MCEYIRAKRPVLNRPEPDQAHKHWPDLVCNQVRKDSDSAYRGSNPCLPASSLTTSLRGRWLLGRIRWEASRRACGPSRRFRIPESPAVAVAKRAVGEGRLPPSQSHQRAPIHSGYVSWRSSISNVCGAQGMHGGVDERPPTAPHGRGATGNGATPRVSGGVSFRMPPRRTSLRWCPATSPVIAVLLAYGAVVAAQTQRAAPTLMRPADYLFS